MLIHFPIGPNEDQTYLVAYITPGTKIGTIVLEHLNEHDAITEAARLNAGQVEREKALQAERALYARRRMSTEGVPC